MPGGVAPVDRRTALPVCDAGPVLAAMRLANIQVAHLRWMWSLLMRMTERFHRPNNPHAKKTL